jgi:hypothetical protein
MQGNLEKSVAFQLLNKYSHILRKIKVHCHVIKRSPTTCLMRQINPFSALPFFRFKNLFWYYPFLKPGLSNFLFFRVPS